MSLKYPHENIIMEPTPNAAYIYSNKENREECLKDTRLHQKAVKQLMYVIADEIYVRAAYHDHTKLEDEDLTFEKHMRLERHHLNLPSGVHKDVNVIDLVEFICDCISAGAQRSYSLDFKYLKVDEALLQPIINNTAFELWRLVRIRDDEGKRNESKGTQV